jgi:hypothetical protein
MKTVITIARGFGSGGSEVGRMIASRLGFYYADRLVLMEGQYPIDANALTVNGEYLSAIPTAKAPNYHADTSVMESLPAACASVGMDFNDFRNGGWIYCGAPNDPLVGSVYVNCTHTDTKSTVWTTY